MNDRIVIYGASGHGKVIADIAILNGYRDIVFYDDDPNKNQFGEYEVVHSFEGLEDYDRIIGIGDNATREKILQTQENIVTLIHPTAVIAADVSIGAGTVVMANAVINPGSRIGKGVIINTCASIDHDNRIGDYSHISVAAHTAGTVTLGNRVFMGIASAIINNVSIADDVKIGAGSVVLHDIDREGTYVGVPVRKIA